MAQSRKDNPAYRNDLLVDQPRFTKDFHSMIQIIKWNTPGFFFLEFLIPWVATQELSASGTEMGVIFAVQILGYTISSPFVGWLTDQTSKTKLILTGSFGRGIAYFVIYLAIIMSWLPGLAIGTFSIGFGAGFFWVPFNTLIAEKSHKKNRAEAYGFRNREQGIGTFFGAFIGFGILIYASEVGLDSIFLYAAIPIFAIANFYAGILFLQNVDEKIKFDRHPFNEIQIPNSTINHLPQAFLFGFILLSVVLFMSSINGSLAKPFLLVYMLENIENNPELATMAFVPTGIISMLLAPKFGEIADRVHPMLGITVASVIGAVVTWLLINTDNLWIFAVLLVIDVTITTTAGLIGTNFISRLSKRHRGKLFGIQGATSSLGAVFGPIIGGFLWDAFGDKSPFLLSIIVELALIPVFVLSIYYILPHLAESFNDSKDNNTLST
ncbi:MAG: MFS transporter [Promethearchaeota archaeon]